ncbi:MAG: arylesterase [Caldilineaceae bacterium]
MKHLLASYQSPTRKHGVAIRYIPLLILFTLLLAACGGAEPTPTPQPIAATATPSEPIIVAMGDSLTEGLGVDPDQAYPAQLERKLHADGYQYTVVNAGVSGETSTGALERVNWVIKLKPQIVILATGGNDSLRGIDTNVTKSNIDKIVKAFKAEKIVVVLAGMQTVQNMGPEYTSAFQAIYPAVAKENDLILIPFFLEGVGGKPELNQADSIHPTAQGYTVVVETIYPYVLDAIKLAEKQ